MATLRHGSGNPCDKKQFQNHHIELYLLLYNISEGSYTPKKPVTMKLSKIRGKTAENSKNRRIQLKYREGGFGNTFIRFPALEYGILKKNYHSRPNRKKVSCTTYGHGRHLGFWPLDPARTRFARGNITNIQKYIIIDLKMHVTFRSRGGADIVKLHAALQ